MNRLQPTAGPVRIVRIIARLNVGGPAQHVSLLAARLGPPRYETTLVVGRVPDTEGDMSWYATNLGVEPVMVESMSREIRVKADLQALWQIYRLLRRLKPTIVHTHTAKAGFVGRVAAFLAGVPIIVHTYHGHALEGYFSPLKNAIFRGLERLVGAMSTCLLSVSAAVRDDLLAQRIAPARKMRVLELGLELQRFADAPRHEGALRRELGLAREVPVVGFCGRLVPIKNVPLFLAACARVHAQRPEVHFVIIGDGELREELDAQAEALGLTEALHVLGWRSDTPQLFCDLDLLALTSRNEGTPVAILEAAAAGVPAVSTAVGGVPTILTDGETGWLVPDDDLEALSAALLAALADPAERDRRGARAQAIVLPRFDVARLARDVDALYEELLAR